MNEEDSRAEIVSVAVSTALRDAMEYRPSGRRCNNCKLFEWTDDRCNYNAVPIAVNPNGSCKFYEQVDEC